MEDIVIVSAARTAVGKVRRIAGQDSGDRTRRHRHRRSAAPQRTEAGSGRSHPGPGASGGLRTRAPGPHQTRLQKPGADHQCRVRLLKSVMLAANYRGDRQQQIVIAGGQENI